MKNREQDINKKIKAAASDRFFKSVFRTTPDEFLKFVLEKVGGG